MNQCECAACQRKETKPATGEDLAIYQQIADNFWHDKKIAHLERTNAEQAVMLNKVIAERDEYRKTLVQTMAYFSLRTAVPEVIREVLTKYAPAEDPIEEARRKV